MTPPPIREVDRAYAAAGDNADPDFAAWFCGVTTERLAAWRRKRASGGPPFVRYGPRLTLYPMAGLIQWREDASEMGIPASEQRLFSE